MSYMSRLVSFGVLGTVLFFAFGSLPAVAAPAKPEAGPAIGVLDYSVLERDYIGRTRAMERISKQRTASDQAIRTLVKGIGLPKDQFDEYRQGTRTSVVVNEKRIKELTELALKNMEELKALYNRDQNKEELKKEERERLEQLMKYYEDGKNVASEMQRTADDESRAKETLYLKKLEEAEAAVIAEVGAAKKLTIVLRKDVQVGEDSVLKFVLWGGIDITQDIVKKLNDTFKESMFDEKPASEPKKDGANK